MRYYLLAVLLLAGACKVEDQDDGPPPVPALKTKILDRMGRAAVNTALDKVLTDMAEKGLARDTYNSSAPSEWTSFVPIIAADLAVYDALDTVCGNQVLAGSTAAAGRYDALAAVLADDRLALDTSVGQCNQYLGVELGVAGDCGGRTLLYDVIDTTYSVLALGLPSGIVDGVDADEEAHSGDVFPFLAAP
jgi:hypothetical protein